MYKLLYHPDSVKKLKRLHPNDRKRIINKLTILSNNPQDISLDIRKLINTKDSFRLRAGGIRAIFEKDEVNRSIYVWDIDYRGSIY